MVKNVWSPYPLLIHFNVNYAFHKFVTRLYEVFTATSKSESVQLLDFKKRLFLLNTNVALTKIFGLTNLESLFSLKLY